MILVKSINQDKILSTRVGSRESTVYLPPTSPYTPLHTSTQNSDIYFDGWLFRNPVGIQKYRHEIIRYFEPSTNIADTVQKTLADLRNQYETVIGLHIRQGDYINFKHGKFYINQSRFRTIINEFIDVYNIDKEKTVFFIASDGHIEKQYFTNLNIHISNANPAIDMFTLAGTNAVIGSDSSFGDFACYYGNIPHIVCKNEAMDWNYYKEKTEFFENKYSTMVHY